MYLMPMFKIEAIRGPQTFFLIVCKFFFRKINVECYVQVASEKIVFIIGHAFALLFYFCIGPRDSISHHTYNVLVKVYNFNGESIKGLLQSYGYVCIKIVVASLESRMSTNGNLLIFQRANKRNQNKKYFKMRIIYFKSPGSPSICGSPSARNGYSKPSRIPGSISISSSFSSFTKLDRKNLLNFFLALILKQTNHTQCSDIRRTLVPGSL